MTPAFDLRGSDSHGIIDLYEEPDTNHSEYVDGVFERMPDFEAASIEAEQTRMEQYQQPYDRVETMTEASRYEALMAARSAERKEAAEREYLVEYAKGLGRAIRTGLRDQAKGDFDLAG